MNRTTKWAILATCLCCGLEGMAQEQNAGKWTPEVGMELTSELQGTHAGDYNYVNLLRLGAALPVVSPKSEGPKAVGLTFEIASLSTCMTAEESIGGDLQTFSNLDAGNIPFALSVCNLVLDIGERHSLYAGIRNMNEDYFNSPVTSFFTNSSCGIYPTISANYPIANYPVASIGLHYRYDGTASAKASGTDSPADKGFVLQASLYNGTGYRHFTGRENVFRFCPKRDGVFGIAQMEYRHTGNSYFLGACTHWGDPTGEGQRQTGTSLWAYTELQPTCRTSLIAGYSHAFASTACSDFVGIGGKYTLPKCELGIFSDLARFEEATEFATEISGKCDLSPHVFVQPSVHAILTGQSFHAVVSLRVGMRL